MWRIPRSGLLALTSTLMLAAADPSAPQVAEPVLTEFAEEIPVPRQPADEPPDAPIAGPAEKPVQPKKQAGSAEAGPLPRRYPESELPPPAGALDGTKFLRELQRLRAEREALARERASFSEVKSIPGFDADPGPADDSSQMHKRVAELLKKLKEKPRIGAPLSPPAVFPEPAGNSENTPGAIAGHAASGEVKLRKPARTNAPPQAPEPHAVTNKAGDSGAARSAPAANPAKSSQSTGPVFLTESPVDPLSLAQALFRKGDYAAAFKVFRDIDPTSQTPEVQLGTQFMMASCLRNQGKLDEAAALYREVGSTEGDPILVETALWHLGAMKGRSELEQQLEQSRQRRKELQARTP